MKKIALYYSIPDIFPAFRVDLSELVSQSLRRHGLDAEWFMANSSPTVFPRQVAYFQQSCKLPTYFSGAGIFTKLTNKFALWIQDSFYMARAACRKFEILQVRDKYIVSITALVATRFSGKKFVYWCSYPFPEHYLELASLASGFRKLYYWVHGQLAKVLLYRVIMPLSDHVFVQSEKMKEDIAMFGVRPEKMTAVPMGVPQRLLDWASEQPSKIVPGQIVYIGIMTPERRLSMLIDAFAIVKQRHPGATLLMVGDGVNPYERALLEHQVLTLGLNDAVRFTGFVPIEEAWSYAASSAIGISPFYPSPVLNSASPTKLNEYMALGRPVVCNHHPEQTAVIEQSGAGLCVEWDSTSFAEAMIWMLEHPEEAEKMGAKGPAWVAANRSYPIIAGKVWQQYQQLLK